MKQYLSEIYNLLGVDKKKLPFIFLLFFVLSLLDVISIGLIGPYIAAIVDPKLVEGLIKNINIWLDFSISNNEFLFFSSLFLLFVFISKTLLLLWINWVIIKFSVRQQIRLSGQLMWAYLTIPFEQYLMRNSSEYIHSVRELTREYANAVIQSLMRIVCDSIVVLAIIIMLAWTNIVTLACLVFLLGVVVITYDILFQKKITLLGKKSNVAQTKMVQGINEGISGLKEIRILGREKYFHSKVKLNAEKYGNYRAIGQIISTSPRPLLELVIIFFISVSVCLMLFLNKDLNNLLPTLAIFAVAAIRLIPAVNVISTSLIKLRNKKDSVHRLFLDVSTHLNTDDNQLNNTNANSTDSFKSLSIRNISFSYPESNINVINNLSLDILHGESIGIIGTSGAGKTTLIDILLGLLTPQQGQIIYNQKLLSSRLLKWRKNVAYMPQDIFLLDDSIKNNIALGVDEIDENNLKEAIQKSKLKELVENLPKGEDTFVGERGMRLSGGQKQRIALARSFYFNKDVLIMDEATSALDSETEKEIVDEIKLLKGTKTFIVIAHRLSTLTHCDKIYKIESGSIEEVEMPQEII